MRRRIAVFLASLVVMLTAVSAPAQAAQLSSGYTSPPFGPTCTVYQFGEGEQPPLWMWALDPLCVEYSKRDITFDNGGALMFLLAEPSRFAIATPSCRYWQQDHWSVQTTQGAVPIVTWDGNYWFDKKTRIAAAKINNFKINGVSAGIGDVVIALQNDFPELAAFLSEYGTEHGETGLSVSLPYDLWCALRN